MKWLLQTAVILIAAFAPQISFAGQYDGIWGDSLGLDKYYIIYQDASNNIYGARITNTGGLAGTWDHTLTGVLVNNAGTLTHTSPTRTKTISVTFTSLVAATIVVQSCSGDCTRAQDVIGFTQQITKAY